MGVDVSVGVVVVVRLSAALVEVMRGVRVANKEVGVAVDAAGRLSFQRAALKPTQ